MHTTVLNSCTIIHDGDFGGEIYIKNINSPFAIGKKAEIATTAKTLILLYKNTINKPKSQTLPGTEPGSIDKDITVLFSDIEDFVKNMLIDKIESKLDYTLKMSTILKVVEALNIKI